MLRVSLFSHAMNGKASSEIVEQMKVLAARNQRAADRQILIDARRTCRIELAKQEALRNNILVQLSERQDLVHSPSWQTELKRINEYINVLKTSLR